MEKVILNFKCLYSVLASQQHFRLYMHVIHFVLFLNKLVLCELNIVQFQLKVWYKQVQGHDYKINKSNISKLQLPWTVEYMKNGFAGYSTCNSWKNGRVQILVTNSWTRKTISWSESSSYPQSQFAIFSPKMIQWTYSQKTGTWLLLLANYLEIMYHIFHPFYKWQ